MADDPLLARMNAALRQAEALRAEARRVQQEAAARAAALRRARDRLSEAMDCSVGLETCTHRPRAPGRRRDPA
ncbi:hypothetical protein [Methylobacterium radiodurans]|uniref:Uncharacterized protein n=1 Tax=Methylobacterium radiodurans TaxID=2202828 RepID=A0A2U8VLB9_9HYPH|nr:hypothetical protein [Methylobacterium radiodurans]AWN34445.1 hypothetical protein DK427_00690 [Methylobacterium radiodurans]